MTDLPVSPLLRVGEGDQTAVQDCVERFGSLVWSLALRYSPSREEAEDAVQEVFIDVWRSASKFDPRQASDHGFVAMITRRRLIDRRRKRDRRPLLVAMPEGFQVASDEHEHMERRIRAGQAMEALDTLRPEQRRFLELSLVQGMSHGQIAEETGAPLGTVKSGIRRGLAEVRSRLRVDR